MLKAKADGAFGVEQFLKNLSQGFAFGLRLGR